MYIYIIIYIEREGERDIEREGDDRKRQRETVRDNRDNRETERTGRTRDENGERCIKCPVEERPVSYTRLRPRRIEISVFFFDGLGEVVVATKAILASQLGRRGSELLTLSGQ